MVEIGPELANTLKVIALFTFLGVSFYTAFK